MYGEGQEDVHVWRGSSMGVFTMKSAYYMQMEREACGLARCSIREKHNTVWKTL
jgi:hypothetical protein